MKILRKADLFPFLILGFFFSLIGYAQEKQVVETSNMEKVMAMHDKAMGKMPELAKMISALESKVDTTENGKKYALAVKNLRAANQSMISWMEGFGEHFTADEMYKGKELSAEKVVWLEDEMKKVVVLNEQIDHSLGYARTLLK